MSAYQDGVVASKDKWPHDNPYAAYREIPPAASKEIKKFMSESTKNHDDWFKGFYTLYTGEPR